MQRISELLNRHEQEPVWIFGKGASLDEFSFDEAGPVRICVNESVLVVPEPVYFFSHDEPPIRSVAASWPPKCQAILEHARGELAQKSGIPEEDIYVYTKMYASDHTRDMSAAELAEHAQLYGSSGTVHCAIHFCRLIGASEVQLVGFDGSGDYASSLHLPQGGAQHQKIRHDAELLLDAMGIPYKFVTASAV